MKGTIVSKNKTELSKIEKDVLSTILDMDLINCKTVKEKLQLADDIPSIRTLSTLRGMDLLSSNDSNVNLVDEKTMQFSNHIRVYTCERGSVQRTRAVIALKYGLSELKKWNGKYGQDLWPFRPTKHFEMKGHIGRDSEGRIMIQLDSRGELLEGHVGKQVNVVLDTL